MSLHEVVEGTATPGTRASLGADLRALGIEDGDLVLVHSSLSALGWVAGGATSVLQALEDVLGPAGTLVMPTHSPDGGDPAQWRNPPVPDAWIPIIREHRPAFDPTRTPTRAMGALPELFRSWPGVRRSDHPIGSFAARGPLAEAVTSDHDLAEMLGERSPLGALYRHDARVLLLGVGHGANTSLHLGEFRADWPGKPFISEGSRVCVEGESRWVPYRMLAWDDDDFPTLGCAFEASQPYTQGTVGAGTASVFSQRALVDFAATWIAENRGRELI